MAQCIEGYRGGLIKVVQVAVLHIRDDLSLVHPVENQSRGRKDDGEGPGYLQRQLPVCGQETSEC